MLFANFVSLVLEYMIYNVGLNPTSLSLLGKLFVQHDIKALFGGMLSIQNLTTTCLFT